MRSVISKSLCSVNRLIFGVLSHHKQYVESTDDVFVRSSWLKTGGSSAPLKHCFVLIMALFQTLVFISLSISTSLSQRVSVAAHRARIVANKHVDPEVIITELVSPTPTLTLERGAYLKILNKNEKDQILKLVDIERGPNEHRRPITFQQVAPEPDPETPKSATIILSPQQLADQIVAERVQLRKPLSVTFDVDNKKLIINGLPGPKPLIELKPGDILKVDGHEGPIEGPIDTIDKEILFIKEEGKRFTEPVLSDDIHSGKVQYKNQGLWHRLDPIFVPIQPTKMAVALAKYDDDKTNPRNSFPKKDEMIHCMLFILNPLRFPVFLRLEN